MNRIIEIASWLLGALSLFTLCFIGFAAMSGVPIQKVPMVGKMFPEPEEETGTPEIADGEAPPPVPAKPRKTDKELVQSNAGILGSWTLPSPYDGEELSLLADEIKTKLYLLEERERKLDQRETRLDEREQEVVDRLEGMESLRSELLRYQQDLELRAQEVVRAEGAADERRAKRWAEVATLIESLDPKGAAQFLTEYDPDQAALILRNLAPDQAAEIVTSLRGIRTLKNWKAYVDAYAGTSVTTPPLDRIHHHLAAEWPHPGPRSDRRRFSKIGEKRAAKALPERNPGPPEHQAKGPEGR